MRQPIAIETVEKEMGDNKIVQWLLRYPLEKISVMKFDARWFIEL